MAAHDRRNMGCPRRPELLHQIGVPIVEGVIFRNNCGKIHENSSFFHNSRKKSKEPLAIFRFIY